MNFLERIQSSDDQTKKRWLIGLSAVIMFVVIWVWLGYFNSLFMRPEISDASDAGSFSFRESLRGGTGEVWNSTKNSLKNFGRIFGWQKEYIVQPD
ncbi:MAG: hypothetical protein V1856_00105 [Candidatus Liptonbacteria bacterium]